jgi:hypothetical protein
MSEHGGDANGMGAIRGGEWAVWAVWTIMMFPEIAHAYVDPSGGGFLLQLLLGGATGIVLFGRLFVRRLSEKIARRFRPPR